MSENLEIEKLPETAGESVLKLANAMVRFQIRLMLPALVVAVVVFAMVFGVTGLWGSLVGAVIAAASSAFTLWLMRLTAHQGPHLSMAAALGGFIGKMIILLVALTLLGDVSALHPKALAYTMLVGVLVAVVADMVAFKRTKIPTVIPS
jgi:ATP synthase protein I